MAISSPRDIPGLVAWYSAQAEAGYTNGAQITQWTDLSGYGNHATALTAGTAKPLWQATTGGAGGPAIRFENGGYVRLPTNIMTGATTGEVMATLKSDMATSASGQQGLWRFGSSSHSNFYPQNLVVVDNFGSYNGPKQFTPTLSIDAWRRYNVWSATDDWVARLDGTAQTSGAVNNTVGWEPTPYIGNGDWGGGTFWKFNGHFGCFVLYNRKLSTTERADLDAWMAANPSGGIAPTIPSIVGRYFGVKGTGNSTVTVSTKPAAGDVVVALDIGNYVGGTSEHVAVSGLGATWSKVTTNETSTMAWWIGTGATSAGTVTGTLLF